MKKSYLATLLSALFVSQAIAQQTNQVPNAEEAENQVERLVVTGQKIDRALQETPASVAVVTEELIEALDLRNMYDILEQVPNVSGKLNGGFSIRGIDAFNVSGGGNSYLTSVYLDGAVLPYRMIQQGAFTGWDVNQVEVLRGPQSTLQGRNALAGAIVMRTQQPTYEWNGKGKVTLGKYGRKEVAIAGGGALVEDQLAFRVSAEQNDFDGMNYNVTRRDKSDFNQNHTYRARLLWEPTDDLTALLSYTNSESEIGVAWVQPAENGDYYSHRINVFDQKIIERTDNDIANLEVEYRINDLWTFTSISTMTDADYGYEWDSDATATPGAVQIDDRIDKTRTQELRLTYEGDDLQAVVGAYYSSLDVADRAYGNRFTSLVELGVPTLLVAPPKDGGLGLPQPLADLVMLIYAPADPVSLGVKSDFFQKVTSSALYADFTYALNENWSVYGGLRYDRESQQNESVNQIDVLSAATLPNPASFADPQLQALIGGLNAQLFKLAADASQDEPRVDDDFSALLPKLGVSYHIDQDKSLHLTYQKGYRSGGVGSNLAKASTYTYDPEYTNNVELSYRSVWLEGDLVVNANLFWLKWKDQQVRVQYSGNRFDTGTENAGESELKGFELETFYTINQNWSLFAGAGLADSEFTNFVFDVQGTPRNLNGRSFARAPKWTGNLRLTYENDGFYANVNANYASSSHSYLDPYRNGLKEGDVGFDPENESRVLVNTRVGYNWGDAFGVYANISNLLGEEYVEDNNVANRSITLGQKRQFSLTFVAGF